VRSVCSTAGKSNVAILVKFDLTSNKDNEHNRKQGGKLLQKERILVQQRDVAEHDDQENIAKIETLVNMLKKVTMATEITVKKLINSVTRK
jgi:DNA-binding protein H-NS